MDVEWQMEICNACGRLDIILEYLSTTGADEDSQRQKKKGIYTSK